MALRPAYKPKIVKKRTKKFIRHQSDRYDKLAVSILSVALRMAEFVYKLALFIPESCNRSRFFLAAQLAQAERY